MISFLVVNWNGEEVFKQCLLSIDKMMWQSQHEYEIVIVDNASDDFDAAWINLNIKNINVYHNATNEMFAKGTNRSVALAKGDLLCIINNDIIFDTGCIEELLSGLKDYKCDLVVPKMLNPDGTVQKSIRGFPTLSNIMYTSTGMHKVSRKFDTWLLHTFDYTKAAPVQQPMFSAMLLPKSTWQKVGDMDEDFPMLFNDVDWFKRFHFLGLQAYYIPGAILTHVHGMSVNKEKVKKVYLSTLGLYRYFIKHGTNNLQYRLGALGVAVFTFAGRLVSELIIKPWR